MSSASPRGFFFWSLSPFLIAFVVLMPLLVQNRGARALVVLVGLEFLALLVFLGLFDPLRYSWAWRGVGLILFLGFCGYFISTVLDGRLVAVRRGDAAAINAIGGTIIFGLPGLWFALTGRLTGRWRFLHDKD